MANKRKFTLKKEDPGLVIRLSKFLLKGVFYYGREGVSIFICRVVRQKEQPNKTFGNKEMIYNSNEGNVHQSVMVSY